MLQSFGLEEALCDDPSEFLNSFAFKVNFTWLRWSISTQELSIFVFSFVKHNLGGINNIEQIAPFFTVCFLYLIRYYVLLQLNNIRQTTLKMLLKDSRF